MKNITIVLVFAVVCLFAFVPNKPKTTTSPFDGSWEQYSTERGGKTTYDKKPSQIKVYHDNYFCLIAYDSTGKFYFGCAGTYELDGNHYKETFTYHTMPEFVGSSIWFDYSIKGDTMVMAGFKKILTADGKDVTKDWGGDSFVEKKVRVKK